MEQLRFYVYRCESCGNVEVLLSDSVAPPEVHLYQTEKVYCPECEEDTQQEFLGLEGVKGYESDSFVLDGETKERYCPLCEGSCNQ